MGIRSTFSSLGRRLRAALADDDKGRNPVKCLVDSSSPASLKGSAWRSRERSQYSSLTNDDDDEYEYMPYRRSEYTPHHPFSPRPLVLPPRRSLSPTADCIGDDPAHRPFPIARFIATLQAALLHVRYAISGHMALRLYDPLWDMGLPPGICRATRPSIVCPLATRDVLPSWAAAASQSAFCFDPLRPDSLQVLVGGRSVTVAIQWVDDADFGRPGSYYELEQTHSVYDLVCHDDDDDDDNSDNNDKCFLHLEMSPPVLSLKALLQQLALSYIQTQHGQHGREQNSLGYQVDACLRLLIRQMAPDCQFLLPYEVPAIHDPTFLDLYYTAFGTMGMQTMLAVSGGLPPLVSTSTILGSPLTRPLPSRSTVSPSSVPSTPSSTSMHSIRRKPLPANSKHMFTRCS